MAETTTRRQGEMIQVLFGILDQHPEGLQAKDAIALVQQAMDLTDFEKATYPGSDVVRFPKILRFSTIGPVKAGWMQKRAGVWTVTEEGRSALMETSDPAEFFQRSRRLYQEWKATQTDEPEPSMQPASAEPEDGAGLLAAATLEEAEESARRSIIEYLSVMNPYRFQDLVGKLLEAMGYHVVWIAPKGKDGGLDLVAQSDPLGVEGPRIKGQVKRRIDSKTTEDELRSFLSLVESNDVGIYVSLGGYTTDAQALSRRSARRITLLDADALIKLWTHHFDRVDEEGRQLLPIRTVYFLDPDAVAG